MTRRSSEQSKPTAPQVGVRLSPETHSWLTAWAAKEHRSAASVARQVLEERRELEQAA